MDEYGGAIQGVPEWVGQWVVRWAGGWVKALYAG